MEEGAKAESASELRKEDALKKAGSECGKRRRKSKRRRSRKKSRKKRKSRKLPKSKRRKLNFKIN